MKKPREAGGAFWASNQHQPHDSSPNSSRFENKFIGFDGFLPLMPKVQRSGNRARFCCPAHQGKSRSAAAEQMPDGSIRIKCFAGCETIEILQAVGLTWLDIIPEHLRHNRQHVTPGKPFFDAMAAINAILVDLNVARIVSNRMIDGTATREDHDALRTAHHRISAVLAGVARV
ncbi:MAG: hypothetical protein AB7U63_17320 [Porticoccaceae bacterium]|jgi:hypothetical protein